MQTEKEIQEFFEENTPKKKRFVKESFYPAFSVMILILISSLNFNIAGLSAFLPVFEVMAIYFWTIFNYKLIPNWLIVILGCLKDILNASTLGINAFTLVLLKVLLKKFGKKIKNYSFILIWIGFSIFALIAIFIKWLLFSFVYGQFAPINFAIMQLFFSISTYPIIHFMFFKINNAINNSKETNVKQK